MQVLSIQIDGPFFRTALIDKNKKIEIRSLQSALCSEFDNVKRLYIAPFRGKIVSGLSGKHLFIRSVELKTGKSRHLEQALSFQSEATSYFPPEDVIHVPYFLKKEKKRAEALLFSTSRQGLKEHLAQLEKWKLEPDALSAWSFGLARYAKWKFPSLANAFLIDLGSSEWTCVWMEKGEIKKSHTLDGGVEALAAAFWEDQKKILLHKELEGVAKQTDLLRLKPPDLPHFYAKLAAMRKELAKAILSFHRLGGQQPLVFTGRIDAFTHLRNFLVDGFREAISEDRSQMPAAEEAKYAICIGLALDPQLQLLQGEFFPKKNLRKIGRSSLLLLVSSLLISCGLVFSGRQIADQRKAAFLSSLKTAVRSWSPNRTIRSDDPQEMLAAWTRSVQEHSKEYPYIMQAPKVAEALSWLSGHPLLRSFETAGDPLQIKEIRYQLVDFPRIGSLKAPYQAKIELEFQVKSPMIARQFHEFLLTEEEWVDSNEEISWETFHEGYRVSFFLKNRGPDVS